jgi:hypothetical protein
MKKVTYTAIIIIACLMSFVSCRKEYHCNCIYNNTLMRSVDLGNMTKDDATKECNKYDTSVTGEIWTCTIY